MGFGFFSRFWPGRQQEPMQLNLELPPRKRKAPAPAPPEPEVLPGNFFFFEYFLELTLNGTTYPCQPASAGRLGRQVRWGCPLDALAKCFENPRIPWVDDPERGLLRRKIEAPGDVLGAEGLFGGKRYRFERILDPGKVMIVYALLNPETQTRIAYGFPRHAFVRTGTPKP